MYQNLINSLKKILDSKATQQEKLLKISTLVDFADGLEKPMGWGEMPARRDRVVGSPYQETRTTEQPNKTEQIIDAKKPAGPGPLLGVEDIK